MNNDPAIPINETPGREPVSICLNGLPFEVPAGCTVSQLLGLAQIRDKLVAVEVNGEVIPKSQHSQHCLQPSDQVEVVTLVGGG